MRYATLLISLLFLVPSTSYGATYYIDFTNGKDTNTGLGTTSATAYQSLNAFANAARSAGDIAIVRRGQASTTNVTAVTFTSDGTLNQPITITADYDNLWGDNATSSVTVTATFGSTYLATSASTTDAYPKKWIYLQGDCYERRIYTAATSTVNPCAFAYEVKSASSTGIDLYLPYKGDKSGAGINMRVMPDAPIVGTLSTAAQIFTMSSDDYWYLKGLDLRSTNASGAITPSLGNRSTVFFDIVAQANGASDAGFSQTTLSTFLKKTRIFNVANALATNIGVTMEDGYIDCNSVAASSFVGAPNTTSFYRIKDVNIQNCTNLITHTGTIPSEWILTNVQNNATQSALSNGSYTRLYFEDSLGVVGLNLQSTNQISANTSPTTTISTTTVTRSGGAASSQYVIPPSGTGNTGISTRYFPYSYMKLGQWGFYAAADVSKTYTVYFRTSSTSAFTRNPFTNTQAGSTTPELFVECEYYKDAADADRQLMRSNTASAVSFTSDTSWYGVSVTCQPSRSGVLYLRAWYAMPKESPTNQFYMDIQPVAS